MKPSLDLNSNKNHPTWDEDTISPSKRNQRRAPDAMKLKLSNFFGVQEVPESAQESWNLPSPDFPESIASSDSTSPSLEIPNLAYRRGSVTSGTESDRSKRSSKGPDSPHNRSFSYSIAETGSDTELAKLPIPSSPYMKNALKSSGPTSPNFSFLRSRPSLNLGQLFRPLRSKSQSNTTVCFMDVNASAPDQYHFIPPPNLHSDAPKEEATAERTFWLLKMIRSSITNGSYLTPRLFVPSLIWNQPKVQVDRMGQKAQHLQWLTTRLEAMAKTKLSSVTAVRSQLDQLDNIVHRIQTSLPRPPSPGSKSVTSIMKNLLPSKPNYDRRHSQPDNHPFSSRSPSPPNHYHPVPYTIEDYALTILQFVDACEAIEIWFHHFLWSSTSTKPPPSIQHGLYRATAFLSHTILSSLLDDITHLLATYTTGITNDICA